MNSTLVFRTVNLSFFAVHVTPNNVAIVWPGPHESNYGLINHFLSTDLEDGNTADGLVFLTCQQDPL